MQNLTRSQLESLQDFMQPHYQQFNIIDIMEKFPKDIPIHELFRDVCIYTSSPLLSYKQINQYMLNIFNREYVIDSNKNMEFINRNQRLYISELENGEFDYKVFLLSQSETSEEKAIITSPIKKQYQIPKAKGKNMNKQPQNNKSTITERGNKGEDRVKDVFEIYNEQKKENIIFAVTHQGIKHFSLQKQKFFGQDIGIEGQSLCFVKCYRNLLGILTHRKKFYLQVDPLAMKLTAKESTMKRKINIIQSNPISFNQDESIIFMVALSQEKWIFCSKFSIWILQLNFTNLLEFKLNKIQIYPEEGPKNIRKAILAKGKYIILSTSENGIILFDTDELQITNKLYNDSLFLDLCFNEECDIIVCTDVGGYLIAMSFNDQFKDVDEQGISFKKSQKKQKKQQKPTTQVFQKKPKYIKGKPSNDPPLNKQRKTPYTSIVENTHKRKLQIVKSKEKSIFTYESLGEKIIKVWDIVTLRVYQKVVVSFDVINLEITSKGLFLISRERGFLSYFNFEHVQSQKDKKKIYQITAAEIDSNYMLITSASLKQTIFYKLKLTHIPEVFTFHSLASSENSIKSAFMRDQVFILNTSNSQKHKFIILNSFGEVLESFSSGYNEYHDLINLFDEKVLFWGQKKVTIQGKKNKKIYNYVTDKKQKVYSNTIGNNNSEASHYKESIIFSNKKVAVVKYFSNFLMFKLLEKGSTNIYLLDEKIFTLAVVIKDMPMNYKILTAHKFYILLQNKETMQMQLYDIHREKTIWKSEKISGWTIQSGQLLSVNKEDLALVVVYRSKSTNLKISEPIYILSKVVVRCEHEVGERFLSLSEFVIKANTNADKNMEQTYTFDEIINRSMPTKLVFSKIVDRDYRSYMLSSESTRIYFPQYFSKVLGKMNEGDASRIQGKIMPAYQYKDKLSFCLMSGGIITLYDASIHPFAEVIGSLDVNNKKERSANQQVIVQWNQQYKLEEQKEWQSMMKDVGRYLSSKKARKAPSVIIPQRLPFSENPQSDDIAPDSPLSPFKFRKYKTEEQEQQSNNYGSPIMDKILTRIEQPRHEDNNLKSTDAKALNNMFYRNYIQKNIMQEKMRETQDLQIRKSLNKNKKSIHRNDIDKLKSLTQTLRKTKLNLNSQNPIPDSASQTTNTKASSGILAKTSDDRSQKLSKKSYSLSNMKARTPANKKDRYQTEALHQLQVSKEISKLFLPEIEKCRTEDLKNNTAIKTIIYDHLKKQQLTMSLQQSRRIISRKL